MTTERNPVRRVRLVSPPAREAYQREALHHSPCAHVRIEARHDILRAAQHNHIAKVVGHPKQPKRNEIATRPIVTQRRTVPRTIPIGSKCVYAYAYVCMKVFVCVWRERESVKRSLTVFFSPFVPLCICCALLSTVSMSITHTHTHIHTE